MDNRLNGTGWGEIPQQELKVPEFMLPDYRTVSMAVPVSAYRAQGKGRVKHQVRAEKKQRRDFRNGIAYIGMMVGLLALANLVVEVICG